MKNIGPAIILLSFTSSLALAQSAAPDPAAGKKLWEGNSTECFACHGKNGEGAFGPDLAGRGLSAAEFQQAVRKPWGIMPAFVASQVSDADLANLAAYFASLQKVAAPGDWEYKATADMPHGQQVFHELGCAQCHAPTFDRGRLTLGGLNADFATFKDIVYNHTDKMRDYDETLGIKSATPAAPQGGGGNRRPPLRMGNFNPTRVTEAELREIYGWAHDDIGFRPDIQGRLTVAAMGPNGATYTLNLSNLGLKGKGVTAQGMTVDLVLPAGASVAATTGDGYKGVHMDTEAKGNVAEWQIPRMAPQDTRSLTITLSKAGTATDNLKGNIRWAKPAPKKGPNLETLDIPPAPVESPAERAGG